MTGRQTHRTTEPFYTQVIHWTTIVVLTLLIVVFVFFIIDEVLTFKAQGTLRPEYRARDAYQIMRSGHPPQASDIDEIKVWMTFDYINDVFHLSPDVLRGALSIVDTRYPRISILHFARETGQNPADVLIRTQDIVRQAWSQKQ